MSDADPVSWYLIEPGWEVVDREGEPVGKVADIAGDSTHDIFDGLSVSVGRLAKPRYVPAEEVEEITQDRVRLKLSKDEVDRLAEYEQPPETAEIEPVDASLRDRLVGWFRKK